MREPAAVLELQFEHAAVFYRSTDEYLDAVLGFVAAGLEHADPVLVAVPSPKIGLLREHRIECGLRRDGSLVLAMDDAERGSLRVSRELLVGTREPGEIWTGDEVEQRTGQRLRDDVSQPVETALHDRRPVTEAGQRGGRSGDGGGILVESDHGQVGPGLEERPYVFTKGGQPEGPGHTTTQDLRRDSLRHCLFPFRFPNRVELEPARVRRSLRIVDLRCLRFSCSSFSRAAFARCSF